MRRTDENTTHFGFSEVPASEKSGMVQELFASVAGRYDLMNDAMSLGAHRLWKSALIDWLGPRSGQEILDLAGGTGDIAMRILERESAASVTVLDLTEEMLIAGRARASGAAISWVAGDALALPFADCSFDRCTIGFGIRNFSDVATGLAEIHRILKTGGRLLVLEFANVGNAGLRSLYDRYSFKIIPALGENIARDRVSYQYLIESIRRFPDQTGFTQMMADAGFENLSLRNLSFGVAALYSGWKL
ncbi:MAG: bifunctional demethylmenaquinone methyltransferase/2-methoxy-6-polyprenyl-1,4-benzoquinol methylase UbiE [Rhodobacteraceae bacterium]|nr:bifunctional demethylmenaquinone methyltransferase/2-methoxy-6-polyprenyl-1,4-benzoquinol methylase UbiE [Paracoccaceae bacterium]